MSDKSFIEEVLRYASQEARYFTSDALFCHLHNTGQTLDGNTADNDVDWLAQVLWDELPRHHEFRPEVHWSQATDEHKEGVRRLARICIKAIPRLQQRIASRLIELSKVMQEIERTERRAYQRKTDPNIKDLQEHIRALEVENEGLLLKAKEVAP